METLNINKSEKQDYKYSSIINGRELSWGPETLDSGLKAFYDKDYIQITQNLLGGTLMDGQLSGEVGRDIDQIQLMSSQLLVPYVSSNGEGQIFPEDRPSIMMHWANRASAFMETDKQNLIQGKTPGGYDINIADRSLVMTQTGNENRPGDIVIQRGELIQNQLKKERNILIDESNLDSKEVKIFNADNLDFYHSSDALLIEAEKYKNGEETDFELLIDFIAENPESLIRIYATDLPTQVLLLYLLQEARNINSEISTLNIEANSPEISSMNRKDLMYPTIEDVEEQSSLRLSKGTGVVRESRQPSLKEIKEQLRDESSLSELGQLGFYEKLDQLQKENGNDVLTYAPGYTVKLNDEKEKYIDNAVKSANRLKEVYGLEKACFKWARTSDGENIVPKINLDEDGLDQIRELASEAYDAGQDVIVVSNSEYLRTEDGDELTPSIHILGGYPIRDQITAQTLDGRQWIGNGILNKADFVEMAGPDQNRRERYGKYFDAMMYTNEALADSMEGKGMAMVGNDVGIFRLGGVFEDQVFVANQDNNWRFTGAFLAYASQELAKEQLKDENISTTTRVINVESGVDYDSVKTVLDQINLDYKDYAYSDVITITPGWSMVYISSKGEQSETSGLMEGVVVERLMNSRLIR